MNRNFQQYCFASIEAQNITRARLETQSGMETWTVLLQSTCRQGGRESTRSPFADREEQASC